MFRGLLSAVRDEASGERALDSIRAISRFHRVQSSPGYDEAARWLEAALIEAGLPVERQEAAGDGATRHLGVLTQRGWECARATATLVGGAERRALCDYLEQKLSLVLRSAPARGTYPIVDVGEGLELEHYRDLEVRGRVVLASGPVHRVHRLAVVERGAAGILTDTRRLAPPVRERGDERDALNYTSFWWSEDEPRGWGFVVTPEEGDRLRERLRRGTSLSLEVAIESRDFATRVPLISTRLGPEGAEEILVMAHLCHPEPSANDNGSGVAAALETARTLASLERQGRWRPGPRAVRFLWMPELTGTYAWLGMRDAAAPRLVAALNLDMVGEDQTQCGSTLLVEHPPVFAASFAEELLTRIRGEAQDWVTSFSGPGYYSMTRIAEVPYSGGSDHIVFNDPVRGVPCPMLIQWPDRFYHSSHDTANRSDSRSLALAVRCAATYAGFLSAAGERELEWLTAAVERGARRRLLAALDAEDAVTACARERVRGRAALASLAKLGVPPRRIEAAEQAREREFAENAPAPPAAPADRGPVPNRRIGAPLDFQPHLWPQYARLAPDEREELRALIARVPGGSTTLELAWYACDGRRGLEEIRTLVRLDGGTEVNARGGAAGDLSLERFFAITARLGLSDWSAEPALAERAGGLAR
jgi:hypothetical protein